LLRSSFNLKTRRERAFVLNEIRDKELIKEYEKGLSRIRSGKFNPSSFGSCYRSQFWGRMNEPKTNHPTVEFMRRWSVGTLYHKDYERYFPDAVKEILVEEDDVKGFLDIELPDRVVDIKTVMDFKFKKIATDGYNPYEDTDGYGLQIGYYMKKRGKQLGELVFVNLADSKAREVNVELPKIEPDVDKELSTLRGYWARKELPPEGPRKYNKSECRYCGYTLRCLSMKGKNV
jgi:hypothetical protein